MEEGGFGFAGEVELGVICIAMEADAVFVENITKGKEVNDKEKGPQDRALGHTSGNRGWV